MKKISIFLVFLTLLGMDVYAQIDIPQRTKALYFVKDATWCGNCGRYGIPYTDTVINRTQNRNIYVSLHQDGSSDLYSPTAKNLYDGFVNSSFAHPDFGVNGTVFGSFSVQTINNVVDSINNFYEDSSAFANTGFNYQFRNDSIIVNCETQFFESTNGEFMLNIYVVEDSIYAYQSNYDPAIPSGYIYHMHILRSGMASDGAYGNSIASDSIAKDSVIITSFAQPLDTGWDTTHLQLFSVIWEKTGASSYRYINGNNAGMKLVSINDTTNTNPDDTTGNPNNVTENLQEPDIKLFPNPATRKVNITVENQNSELHAFIYDSMGRMVKRMSLNQPNITVELNSGTYLVRVVDTTGKIRHPEKVIVN